MTERDTKPGKHGARAKREERLAEALRANLRRRKRAAAANPSADPVDIAAGVPDNPPDSKKNED